MRRISFGLILSAALLTSCGTPAIDTGPGPQAVLQSPVAALPTPKPTEVPLAPTTVQQPTQVPQSQPTLVPTSIPTPIPTPVAANLPATANQKTITVVAPIAGTILTNPATVRGSTNFWPFEANLTGRIIDAAGQQLGIGPVMVNAPDIGQGGPFEAQIPFISPATTQDGTLELFEASAKDGSIVVKQAIKVRLAARQPQQGLTVDAPQEGQAVTLPLHIAVRGLAPNDTLIARLRFYTGDVIEQQLEVVASPNNEGFAVANMQWNTESMPPVRSGNAVLELLRDDGMFLQQINVRVLPDNETQPVEVVWTTGEQFAVFQHAVPKTPQIASAALQELLNGPPEGNAAGATTALPTYKEILTFHGRQADWGYEVKLLKLTITDGVATANFSKELRAYGGGAARVQMIREQIERTLKQFPAVQQVVIQIEGQSAGVLEP